MSDDSTMQNNSETEYSSATEAIPQVQASSGHNEYYNQENQDNPTAATPASFAFQQQTQQDHQYAAQQTQAQVPVANTSISEDGQHPYRNTYHSQTDQHLESGYPQPDAHMYQTNPSYQQGASQYSQQSQQQQINPQFVASSQSMPQPTPQSASYNAQPNMQMNYTPQHQTSQATQEAQAFWHWIVASLRTPSAHLKQAVWYPFAITVLSSLFMGLSIYGCAWSLNNSVIGQLSQFFGRSTSVSAALFFKSWLFILILLYVIIAISYVSKKILGSTLSIQIFHEILGQRLLILVPASAITALLSFMMPQFSALLITFELSCISAIPNSVISSTRQRNKSQLDKFWVWLISFLVTGIITALTYYLTLFSVFSTIIKSFSLF